MIGAPPALQFTLPRELVAASPPEARGLERDEVRLLVAGEDGLAHDRFRDLASYLEPGDLIVVNTSPTMPAALAATMRGEAIGVHLSSHNDDGSWVVELRQGNNSGPVLNALPNEVIRLRRGGSIRLVESGDDGLFGGTRLWRAAVDVPGGLRRFVSRHGRPIRYAYLDREWPLYMYQTVFAGRYGWPGSAEMPSAGRPFSKRVLDSLRRRHIAVAPIRLDTGVSSLEAGELPYPERFEVPATTAFQVNRAREKGRRVVAVGTTVTRALETAADIEGRVDAAAGWTSLVLGPDRPARVVDGLITGFHPAEASHLDLLQAVVGRGIVRQAYDAALGDGYLWHEFGDSNLLLAERRVARFRAPRS